MSPVEALVDELAGDPGRPAGAVAFVVYDAASGAIRRAGLAVPAFVGQQAGDGEGVLLVDRLPDMNAVRVDVATRELVAYLPPPAPPLPADPRAPLRAALEADEEFRLLREASPEAIDLFVDDRVTTMAHARRVLKLLLKMALLRR